MENVDMFNAATAPLTFHDFLDRMRQPAAADLARSIKSFIITFLASPPDPEKDSQSVQEFYNTMEEAFRAHSLWAGATKEELESAGEGLEKYLMTKLFSRAFAPLSEDAERDHKLHTKMNLLQQFLHPEHLDIAPSFQNESSWLLAQKELHKINTYKAPRDKLVCILNCCRVINNLLLNAMMAKNDNPPGADDFLPVLIYVTIKANPPQLHSNLLYIQKYRHRSRLVSEAAYFYTNLVSAASFIENLDAKSLSMDEKEYNEKMESAKAIVDGVHGEVSSSLLGRSEIVEKNISSADKGNKSFHTDSPLTKFENPSIQQTSRSSSHSKHGRIKSSEGDHANVSSHLDTNFSHLKFEAKTALPVFSKQLARKFPYLYARAGDLTVADVETLLNDYKELVVKYVALHKSMENSSPHKVVHELKPMVSEEKDHINLLKPNDHNYDGESIVRSVSGNETSHSDSMSDIFHGLQVSLGTIEGDKGSSDFESSGVSFEASHSSIQSPIHPDSSEKVNVEASHGSIPSPMHPDSSEKVTDLEVLEEDVKRELKEQFSSDVHVSEKQATIELVHPGELLQKSDSEFEDKLPQGG